jgi:histidinol-phosphate aminotransferase
MYEVVANINAISSKKVNQLSGFQLDVEGILNQVDENTKIVFICSPNNPSGNAVPKEDIIKIIESVPCMVFLDEAYIDFSDEPSFTSLLIVYPNLIIGQTLSKFYGLAGLRIGMGIASKEIIAVLNKIKPPYNINSLSQKTAINELKNIDYDNQLALIKAERNRVMHSFEGLNCIKEIFPTDANFVLIKVSNATELYNYLVNHSVIVRNRSTQYLCDNCLRITIGLPHENDRLIELLSKYDLKL